MTRRVRQAGTLAWDALRRSPAHVAVTAAVCAVALGIVVALPSLSTLDPSGAPVLQLPPVPSQPSTLEWTYAARDAGATQRQALNGFLDLLRLVAWAGLCVALATVLMMSWARAARRGPELGIHRSVGASLRILALSALAEGAVLSLGVLVLSVGVGYAAFRALLSSWPEPVGAARFVPGAMGLLVAASVVALGALLSLRYAGRTRRIPAADGAVSLKIPAAQIAVSLAVLMAGALVFERAGALAARGARPDQPGGLLLRIGSSTADPSEQAGRFHALLQELGSRRGSTASLSSAGYHLGLGTVDYVRTECGNCVGTGGVVIPWHSFPAVVHFVSPDSFAARSARLVAGRLVTQADAQGAEPVAVVNRHLAGQHFEAGDAVGRRIFFGGDILGLGYRVIGIVDDQASSALGGASQPRETVYLGVLQHPPSVAELRVAPEARWADATLVEAARDVLGTEFQVQSIGNEQEHAARAAGPLAWVGLWFGATGAIALGIGIIGAMTTMVLWVRAHASELTLRRAVGATRLRIMGIALFQALRAAAGGLVLGWLVFVVVLWTPISAVLRGVSVWDSRLTSILVISLTLAAAMGALLAVRPINTAPPGNLLR